MKEATYNNVNKSAMPVKNVRRKAWLTVFGSSLLFWGIVLFMFLK